MLIYLLGSRYCDTDRLSETAWSLFGQGPAGWALVQNICTACGWTVRAANRADGGACLTLDFGAVAGSGSGSSSAAA